MTSYEKINTSRKILDLPERATMEQIKSNFRSLAHRWHPDKCKENPSACAEKTRLITEAYKTILAYCSQYKYSFAEVEVNKYLTAEEWWDMQFGEFM